MAKNPRTRTSGTNPIKAEVDALKRKRILDEAVEQFFRNGYEGTSLESIADALGVTKQFIYSRFASKSELLVCVCRLGAAPADNAVELSEKLEGDPPSRLAAVIQDFVRHQIENRREVALYFSEAKSLPEAEAEEIASSKSRFHRMLRGILDDGKQAGLFDFENSSIAASALGGMASCTFFWFQPEGRWEPESVARQVAALSLKTVGVAHPDKYVSGFNPGA
ncbi:MAG: TetR/AcrR family transcriptional regulator [Novosphingobium sp.]